MARAEESLMWFLARLLQFVMRPAASEFSQEIRQMQRTVARQVNDRPQFLPLRLQRGLALGLDLACDVHGRVAGLLKNKIGSNFRSLHSRREASN
jgi:hypothetical protein